MHVTVKLFAALRKYLPEGATNNSFQLVMGNDATVKNLVAAMSIPARIPKIVLVNGRNSSGTQKLKEDDVVSVIPPISGG